jgi:hypothetical protein
MLTVMHMRRRGSERMHDVTGSTSYLQGFVLLQKHGLTGLDSEGLVRANRTDAQERTEASHFTKARRIRVQERLRR